MKLKKITLTVLLITVGKGLLSQTAPSVGNSNTNNPQAWSRAGNDLNSGSNLFGTRFNSPIYFITGGGLAQHRRMKLNGVFSGNTQYPINGYGAAAGVNTTGYLLLGTNNNSLSNATQNIYEHKGAFSLLHLNGEGSAFQEYGYRPWMKTGVTMKDNQDFSYL